MNRISTSEKDSINRLNPITPISTGVLIILFIFFVIVQLALYRESFSVKPSVDDFTPPLAEIYRGETQGPSAFFKSSQLGNYRPLDSLLMWTFGRISDDNRFIWIRVLHFLSAWFYAFVAILWIRLFRFSRLASILVLTVIFLHPILVGPIAAVDGSSRILVNAFIWLGLYFVYRYMDISRATALFFGTLFFLISLGFMEYGITYIPLAFIAALIVSKKSKLLNALLIILPAITLNMLYLFYRALVAQQGTSFLKFVSLNPIDWVKNAVIIFSGIFFFGDTVVVKTSASPLIMYLSILSIVLLVLIIVVGLSNSYKNLRNTEEAQSEDVASYDCHVKFLIYALIFSCFPMVFMKDLSEVYLSGMVYPFAMLVGFASYGFAKSLMPYKALVSLIIVLNLVMAIGAVKNKVSYVKDLGYRTDSMASEILKYIPESASNLKIALVFLRADINIKNDYSIFKKDDIWLIQPTLGDFAMNWYCPGKGHSLKHLVYGHLSEVKLSEYDIVLVWNYQDHTAGLVYKRPEL